MDGAGPFPEDIRNEVLRSVKPDPDRRKAIERNASDLIDRVKGILLEMSRDDVEALLVGSISKGTMTFDPDLDIFLIFPYDTDVKDLERIGLEVGTSALTSAVKKYTQHPYMTGTFRGMNADIVPCLSIPRGSKVVTAVDRTPYHTEYVNEKLREDQRDEVVLLKSFLKGIGAYGAEDVVGGFSGYLVELMIIRFGSFDRVIDYFSDLEFEHYPPAGFEVIRPAPDIKRSADILKFDSEPFVRETPLDDTRYRKMFGNDVMIFIDPVDPSRNVASPVSSGTLAHVSQMAGSVRETPSRSIFWPFTRRPILPGKEGSSGSYPQGYMLHTIDLPADNPGIVISQLKRSLGRCRDELIRSGFDSVEIGFAILTSTEGSLDPSYLRNRGVYRVGSGDDRIAILLKVEPGQLEDEMIHWGPPIDNPRTKYFRAKWSEHHRIFEKDGRLHVILKREDRDPARILMRIWGEISHGTALRGSFMNPAGEKEIFDTDITPNTVGNGIE